ncbi:ROK family protein [Paenibacillus qinlingensis]|uniref:Glucokinase n=1 Tax=Paenibacillus qinlingensis TaxID=1837343 RepID=A0ABU1NZG4_9BACL|nr:ROK family protein [Paenibacillus qinlingensis]MDR6552232.1 glucokinase [Paenibacillus qinlingensis]
MMSYLAGVDIGGTKCALSLGRANGEQIEIVEKVKFATPSTPEATIAAFISALDEVLLKHSIHKLTAIGISCGGPLNSRAGLVLSPPNLPGWDSIDIVSPFRERYGVPIGLQNDANACALAEWKWGAGQGTSNMVFLTFGTGMGAGLILNGKLYAGTNDMGGEVGNIRLEPDGPVGYGKAGSFEGFCSGGGIAQLAKSMALQSLREGGKPTFCPTEADVNGVTAQTVGEAAQHGDPLALDVYRVVGKQLGRGLAVLVDLLNPACIVIGSIFARQQSILEPILLAELRREAIPLSLSVCRIVPAGLGEQVGDYASLSVALYTLQNE